MERNLKRAVYNQLLNFHVEVIDFHLGRVEIDDKVLTDGLPASLPAAAAAPSASLAQRLHCAVAPPKSAVSATPPLLARA